MEWHGIAHRRSYIFQINWMCDDRRPWKFWAMQTCNARRKYAGTHHTTQNVGEKKLPIPTQYLIGMQKLIHFIERFSISFFSALFAVWKYAVLGQRAICSHSHIRIRIQTINKYSSEIKIHYCALLCRLPIADATILENICKLRRSVKYRVSVRCSCTHAHQDCLFLRG